MTRSQNSRSCGHPDRSGHAFENQIQVSWKLLADHIEAFITVHSVKERLCLQLPEEYNATKDVEGNEKREIVMCGKLVETEKCKVSPRADQCHLDVQLSCMR